MTPDHPDAGVEITDADRRAGRKQVDDGSRWVIPAGIAIVAAADLAAALTVQAVAPTLRGWTLAVVISATALALIGPLLAGVAGSAKRRGLQQVVQTFARERMLRAEARRREFETRLANALEMADTEAEALAATGRALRHVVPDDRVEVLLADNSHAHLERALVSGPDPTGPGCRVESPSSCVAARRGQTQIYTDSDALDACTRLHERPMGRCAAVCVPVSITGRTVGVVHLATPLPAVTSPSTVEDLEVLANQVGARLGMLRMMTETRLQAGTDGLTGLSNRRSFENQVRLLRQAGTEFTAVMADLDHFKKLNDSYGHETGDRALRVFSNVLRTSLRPTDLFCRYGGEEFVLVLPECGPDEAIVVCERIREELALTLEDGDTPQFTASFGVAASSDHLSFDDILALADHALYEAKDSGRNRTVVFRDGMRSAPPTRSVTSA